MGNRRKNVSLLNFLDKIGSNMALEINLILLMDRTQIYLDVIAKINREDPKARLIVVDVSSYNYPIRAPWRVPGLRGSRSANVLGLFDALGVQYIDGAKVRPTQTDFTVEESQKMSIAIKSTIISAYVRGIRLRTRPYMLEGYLNKRFTSQCQEIFSLTTQLIRHFSASKVFVPNGRFAIQHATYLAARRENAKPFFYEAFSSSGKTYLTEYRVHDRIKRQGHALEATSMIKDNEIQAHSNDVLAKNKDHNIFGSLWEESRNAWKGPRDSLALFATSSQDETASLDLDWNEASWSSQYEAFQAIWRKLKLRNLTPVLRVHPNLLNKGPSTARREIKEIRRFKSENPEFHIVWPASPVSTYDLISYSDVVVVDNSTVGLEASTGGVPVICSNSSAYDIIADVVKVHGPEDLDKIDNMSKTSDPRGAQRYIAFAEMLLEPIPRNEFSVDISNFPKLKLVIPSLIDGSIFSMVFELRWRIYRLIMLKTTPRR
jgi:hypothetical protein